MKQDNPVISRHRQRRLLRPAMALVCIAGLVRGGLVADGSREP